MTANSTSRLLFLLMCFTISIVLTSYSMHVDKTRQIVALQEVQANASTTMRPVTKQEIRTLIETISPQILQEIDRKQEEALHIFMSIPTFIKVQSLSEQPDFSKYLSVEKSGKRCIGGQPEAGVIKEAGANGYMDGYYFHPKDALIK